MKEEPDTTNWHPSSKESYRKFKNGELDSQIMIAKIVTLVMFVLLVALIFKAMIHVINSLGFT